MTTGFLSFLGTLTLIGWIGNLGRPSKFPTEQIIVGIILLLLVVSGLVFLTIFGMGQSWSFDKGTGEVQHSRAGIRVRTESMSGLTHLELKVVDDDDGGAAQALLVYKDRPPVPINRVNTGHIKELKELVDAVNQFLSAPH